MADTLDTRLGNLEELVNSLQKKLEEKDRQIQGLLDIEAVKRLQCAYAYYLEHWMGEEIIALFADHPEVSGTFVEGTYLGLKGIRQYFGNMKNVPPSFLHQVMQVSPVITLSDDGLRAKGRWFGYGTICMVPAHNDIDPIYMSVVYEMEYIKENGIWKILKLAFQMHYAYQPTKVFGAKAEAPKEPEGSGGESVQLHPDIWADYDTQYPSGYIFPFHFNHPVTGKETSEAAYNAGLKLQPNRFRPK